jgi:hypothetical protein
VFAGASLKDIEGCKRPVFFEANVLAILQELNISWAEFADLNPLEASLQPSQ